MESNNIKILLVSNLPTKYFVDYAKELAKYVDLTVVIEKNMNLHKKKPFEFDYSQLGFKLFFLEGFKINSENYLSFKILNIIKNNIYKYIVFANPLTATGIIGELYCKKHKIPYICQSEGGFQGKGNGIKEKIKELVLKDAVFYLTGCPKENNYFLKYGATESQLKRYNFTSHYSRDIDSSLLDDGEKKIIKKSLLIKEELIILCVAQFIHRKGIDTLLKACHDLPNNVGIYIIGGTPTKEYISLIDKLKLSNVHFIERIEQEKLANYYRVSDIFVLLTRKDIWGLVINEAMAHGLPVITTTAAQSGIVLIKDNENGFLVSPEDSEAANSKILFLLNNPEIRIAMGKNNLKKIKDWTLENMAKQIAGYLTE